MQESVELFPIGRISGTHGIKGQLKVYLYSGSPETLAGAGTVVLRDQRGKETVHRVDRISGQGKKTLLVLDNFDDVNDVLPLVGSEVLVRRDQFPALDENEYFWCDLEGLMVVTESGETLGVLSDLIETGSNDVYIVRSDAGEVLIPAIEDIVVDVDLDRRVMTVRPPDGLLDL